MSDQVTGTPSPASTGEGQAAGGTSGQEQTEQKTGESQKQDAAPPAERRKVKVKDREFDEDEVDRVLQKRNAADETFREAARMSKSTKAFLDALEKDPESVLSDPRLPIDRKKLAEKWLRDSITAELEEPHEKAAREKDAELKRYKDKEASDKEKADREAFTKAVTERKNAIGSTLSKAMELSPLSKDPEVQASTLREMALYLRICKQQGWSPTAEEIADHVGTSKISTLKRMAESLTVEDLITTFGEGFVQKLHKHALSKLQASRQKPPAEVQEDWQPRSSQGKREFVDPLQAAKRAQNGR